MPFSDWLPRFLRKDKPANPKRPPPRVSPSPPARSSSYPTTGYDTHLLLEQRQALEGVPYDARSYAPVVHEQPASAPHTFVHHAPPAAVDYCPAPSSYESPSSYDSGSSSYDSGSCSSDSGSGGGSFD
jgi:hypothetical protein